MTVTVLSTIVTIAGEHENFVLPVEKLGKYSGDIRYSIDKDLITLNNGIEQKIPLYAYDDYPLVDIPLTDPVLQVEFSIDLLDELIEAGKFASTEETRYVLNGVCIDKAGITSTCGKILFHRDYDLPLLADRSLIIPTDALKVLKSISSKTISETFRLQWTADEKQKDIIKIIIDNITVTVKLIDGTYPNYPQAIPADKTLINRITFNRAELLGLLKQYVKVQKGDSRIKHSAVYFNFSDDDCELRNLENTVSLKVINVTKDLKQECKLYAFNAYFLIKLFESAFYKELATVRFEYDGYSSSSFLFRAINVKTLICPVRII